MAGHRARTTALAAGGLVLTLATSSYAANHGHRHDAHPHPGGMHVTTQFSDPGAPKFSKFGADCPIQPPAPNACEITFTGVTKETGPDLIGSTVYNAKARYGGSADRAMHWEVLETFTGTVAGCGAGTFVWHGTGYADLTQLDPSTLSFPLWGTLPIVPGSGTGDLAGIAGTLAVQARATLPFEAQTGTISGTLSCGNHDDSSDD